jgi:hypothetical protein
VLTAGVVTTLLSLIYHSSLISHIITMNNLREGFMHIWPNGPNETRGHGTARSLICAGPLRDSTPFPHIGCPNPSPRIFPLPGSQAAAARCSLCSPHVSAFAGPFAGDEHPPGMPFTSLPFLLCEKEHPKPKYKLSIQIPP